MPSALHLSLLNCNLPYFFQPQCLTTPPSPLATHVYIAGAAQPPNTIPARLFCLPTGPHISASILIDKHEHLQGTKLHYNIPNPPHISPTQMQTLALLAFLHHYPPSLPTVIYTTSKSIVTRCLRPRHLLNPRMPLYSTWQTIHTLLSKLPVLITLLTYPRPRNTFQWLRSHWVGHLPGLRHSQA